jgi:hypothetical protein
MTTQLSYRLLVFTVLQHVTSDRLQRAVNALTDGSLTITLTRFTDNDIRALVKNGDGREYGVTITDGSITCSCKDALYRGTVCKHAVALALYVLRSVKEYSPTIHLVMKGNIALCGIENPEQCWQYPYFPKTEWSELCPTCKEILHQPIVSYLAAHQH